MKSLKKYSIPFTGLALGKHSFEFDVDDSFFDEFEYSLIKKGNLKCDVELEKQETMLILNFHISGSVQLNCDRCLREYPETLDIREQQIAKFSEEEMGEDDEIITLGKNDHEIDISGLIYEYITVAVPFVASCGTEGDTSKCDKEMLDKLNSLSGSDEEKNEAPDPRWDALKNIK
ncbi:MAG: DUF177 domain-containing protein [Sphingobacteriaceae bacterium]|nr:MAG: DUF177 domain-containing protein [Sphingobacteriaceae bacterium]